MIIIKQKNGFELKYKGNIRLERIEKNPFGEVIYVVEGVNEIDVQGDEFITSYDCKVSDIFFDGDIESIRGE